LSITDCKSISFSYHAIQRMFERGLSHDTIVDIIHNGDVIMEYPEDKPLPSALILGYSEGLPIHAVIAFQYLTGHCLVITVYSPDSEKWGSDFKKRKAK